MERINPEVKVGDHASDILAVKIVVGGVDVPDTPVGVVVTVSAGTEGTLSPEGCSLPVGVVMARMGRNMYEN